jgi:hypothetical protein
VVFSVGNATGAPVGDGIPSANADGARRQRQWDGEARLAADLAQSFSDLRRRNIDLFAVALMAPQFSAPPALDASGRLRLSGFFATRPLRIDFDLTFQSVGGLWRLLAISVATPGSAGCAISASIFRLSGILRGHPMASGCFQPL